MLTPEPTHCVSKRRLACERCRNQKLKCIRTDENRFEPCVRCLHAQAECIVSLRKAPGRPAGRNNPSAQHISIREDRDTSRTDALGSRTIDPTFLLGAGSLLSPSLLENAFDFTLDSSGGSDPATLFSSASSSIGIPELTDSLLDYPEPPTEFSMGWSTLDESGAASRRQSFHLLDQNSDPGFQLSRLQQKLSKQLFLLRSLSWDVLAVMKLDGGPCGCQRTSYQGNNREFNPLASTFALLTEFESVLNTMTRMSPYREQLQGTITPSVRPEMNVSYSLTAMSCYLQLVFIYDCIFSYVLDQASSNPVVRDFILHSTPNVSLGGFVVPSPKNVFGRLLVQLMQLKIRPIESALGLPNDCCVSNDPDGDRIFNTDGLLSSRHGESLLVALKESGAMETNDTKASGSIEALRMKMTRIEAFQ